MTPLEIVCVGSGRDGTQSLNRMLQQVFQAEGRGRSSAHEYAAREFYNAFCGLAETGEEAHRAELARLVAACTDHAIVGNGYAAALDLIAACAPRPLKLIHVQRRDKQRCLHSLMRDAEDMPEAYRYYGSDDPAHMKRLAAFHLGEMSLADWERLPLVEKFSWYYDATHRLIGQHSLDFADYMHVWTEELSAPATRRALCRFVGAPEAAAPEAVHMNTNVDGVADLAPELRFKAHWLLRPIDLRRIVEDDVALTDHALERLRAWLGFKAVGRVDGLYPTPAASAEEIRATLARTRSCLARHLAALDEFEAALR